MIDVEGFESGGIVVAGGESFPRLVVGVDLDWIGVDLVLAGVSSLLGEDAILLVASVAIGMKDGDLRGVGRAVGGVKLQPIHESWTGLSLLSELGVGRRPAIQVVPLDSRHLTIDVPTMSSPWSSETAGAWLRLSHHEAWPHSFPDTTTVVTNHAALSGNPITEISRWADGEWQMFAITADDLQPEEVDIRVVPMLTLVSLDPTPRPAFRHVAREELVATIR